MNLFKSHMVVHCRDKLASLFSRDKFNNEKHSALISLFISQGPSVSAAFLCVYLPSSTPCLQSAACSTSCLGVTWLRLQRDRCKGSSCPEAIQRKREAGGEEGCKVFQIKADKQQTPCLRLHILCQCKLQAPETAKQTQTSLQGGVVTCQGCLQIYREVVVVLRGVKRAFLLLKDRLFAQVCNAYFAL